MINDKPLIIAHRGASGEAPENTIASFQMAVEQGCDAIELDIHLSADGEIVVCHDHTLNRTTDRIGAINQLSLEDIKRTDAGKKFHKKYEGERIPLLEEVFDLISSEIMINVEIKDSYGRQMEAKLLDLIRRKNRLGNVVVSSFDHKSLAFLKLLEPAIQIGLLYAENVVSHAKLADNAGVPVFSLHPNFKRIDAEDVREVKQRGLQLYPYTINDSQQMMRAIEMGVSGIITNYPARLRDLIK